MIILASLLGAPAPSQPVFDLIALHRMTKGDDRPEHIENPIQRGYLQAVNVNVKSLMEIAYDIPDLRMLGGPAWLASERFSIEAKADPRVDEQLAALPMEQAKTVKREMVVALLKERFQLTVHEEAGSLPVYAMTVAKGGPRLGDEKAGREAEPRSDEIIVIREGSDSLQILAYELSWRLGRPVLDRTGIQDTRSLILRWRDNNGTATNSDAPSVFTALKEQLGLELDATRGSVPVLVIDHVKQPVEQ